MPAPTSTYNAAGNLIASGSVPASGNTSAALDLSARFSGQVFVKVTMGGSVAATRGARIDIFPRYGAGPTDVTVAWQSFTFATATAASGTDSAMVARLPTGKYTVKVTNLDASNAITVEATTATVDTIA